MPNKNPIDISSLYYSAVNSESVRFDFGNGWGETWESVAPYTLRCTYCQALFSDHQHEEGDACPDVECFTANGCCLERPDCDPMMNYYYPLPSYHGDPEADQALLVQSSANVVLVKLMGGGFDAEDFYAVALSGAGMDFSLDICHAYIMLGYSPPLAFCDLPIFAGQDYRKEPYASIIKACLQSVQSAQNRLDLKRQKLTDAQSWTGKV